MHFFIGTDDISYSLFSRGSGIFSDSLLGYGRSLSSLDEVLESSKQRYLFFTGLTFSLLVYFITAPSHSSSIPTALLYRGKRNQILTPFRSLLILNGLICLFCVPWFLFVILNYKGQPIMDPLTVQEIGSFSSLFFCGPDRLGFLLGISDRLSGPSHSFSIRC